MYKRAGVDERDGKRKRQRRKQNPYECNKQQMKVWMPTKIVSGKKSEQRQKERERRKTSYKYTFHRYTQQEIPGIVADV